MNKISVIIPTLLKDIEVLKKLLHQLENDDAVSEIILIDNSRKGFNLDISKLRVVTPSRKENLYVNQSWNLGVKEAKEKWFALFNDDLLVCENFCSKVVELIEQTPDLGTLGMATESVINRRVKDYPANTNFYLELDSEERGFNWGTIILGNKDFYEDIPANIKIWCGDDYIRYSAKNKNKQVYALYGAVVYHLGALSSGNPKLKRIKYHDVLEYAKIDESFKKSEAYSIVKDYYSLKERYRRAFGWLFWVESEYRKNRKSLLVKILGFKFRIRLNSNLKYQREYYKFLESSKNLSKEKFVSLTDRPYKNLNTVKPIAFYLPQFHAIPLNDENFGKGFTEWSNVAKTIPQFDGHWQPHLPIDVGFYNLENDNVMYRQIELAKMYGIYGFCFHYYWFSGQRLLEKPIFNYLNNKDLDLPFCLCWANENWSRLWDGGDKEIVMEQQLQDDDDEKFFKDILPFFKDERYIKIDNKPVLIIYRLNLFEKERVLKFVNNIKTFAQKEGFDDIYIIGARAFDCLCPENYGADAAVEFPPLNTELKEKELPYVNTLFVGKVFDMEYVVKEKKYRRKINKILYRTLFPSWDNTARKARSNATVLQLTPELYKAWFKDLVKLTQKEHPIESQFVFINAWNEWAEGAHLEPDSRFGYAYLQATKEVLEETI